MEQEMALIRRLQAGDQDAFAKLLETYEKSVYNLCLRMTGNREDAAELQRKMVENSDRLIVVADSAKLGGKALCRSVDAGRISLLITDFEPRKHPVVAALRKRGVRVLVLSIPE